MLDHHVDQNKNNFTSVVNETLKHFVPSQTSTTPSTRKLISSSPSSSKFNLSFSNNYNISNNFAQNFEKFENFENADEKLKDLKQKINLEEEKDLNGKEEKRENGVESVGSGSPRKNGNVIVQRRSARNVDPVTKWNEAIEELANVIVAKKKIVFITGAGLSVASGVPPFRGSSDAVWEESVQEWGTKKKFLECPKTWFETFYSKHFDENSLSQIKPNEGHVVLKRLADLFPETVRIITQNIDGLHRHETANVSHAQLIEIHGATGGYKCFNSDNDCPFSYDKIYHERENSHLMITNVDESVKKDNSFCLPPKKRIKLEFAPTNHVGSQFLPTCPSCFQIMAPNCLLFDEDYSDHSFYRFETALEWLDQCDHVVFVGTSFSVNITDIALDAIRESYIIELETNPGEDVVNSKSIFNLNLNDNVPLTKSDRVQTKFIKGKCEETLPEILDRVLKLKVI